MAMLASQRLSKLPSVVPESANDRASLDGPVSCPFHPKAVVTYMILGHVVNKNTVGTLGEYM